MEKLGFFTRDARQMMKQHGLEGWRLDVSDRLIRTHAKTNSTQKTITFSRVYLENNSEERCMNTLLHELAHAIVGAHHQHDEVWRQKARELGCNGQRLGENDVKVLKKFVGTCPNCSVSYTTNRRKSTAICRPCNRSGSGQFKFVYKDNPRAGEVVPRDSKVA